MSPGLPLLALMWLCGALSTPARAYETDQITDRLVELQDSGIVADDEVDRILAAALEQTNRQTGCHSSVKETRRLLAESIYDIASFPTYVHGRGELAGLGYGAYAAWLETDARVDRRPFVKFGDIYDLLRPTDSLVLGTVGVCSTIHLAGILMGTDKPDHFWSQGYEYFLASRRGRADERAMRWGTLSERGQYGLATSGVFSYADLAANWEGYQFYKALLTEDSPLELGEDGCVVQTRPFRWVDWITDAVDEAVNPPNYGKVVRAAVQERLLSERDNVCQAYTTWGPEVMRRRAQVVAEQASQLVPTTPPRLDEWQLDSLCKGYESTNTVSRTR